MRNANRADSARGNNDGNDLSDGKHVYSLAASGRFQRVFRMPYDYAAAPPSRAGSRTVCIPLGLRDSGNFGLRRHPFGKTASAPHHSPKSRNAIRTVRQSASPTDLPGSAIAEKRLNPRRGASVSRGLFHRRGRSDAPNAYDRTAPEKIGRSQSNRPPRDTHTAAAHKARQPGGPANLSSTGQTFIQPASRTPAKRKPSWLPPPSASTGRPAIAAPAVESPKRSHPASHRKMIIQGCIARSAPESPVGFRCQIQILSKTRVEPLLRLQLPRRQPKPLTILILQFLTETPDTPS